MKRTLRIITLALAFCANAALAMAQEPVEETVACDPNDTIVEERAGAGKARSGNALAHLGDAILGRDYTVVNVHNPTEGIADVGDYYGKVVRNLCPGESIVLAYRLSAWNARESQDLQLWAQIQGERERIFSPYLPVFHDQAHFWDIGEALPTQATRTGVQFGGIADRGYYPYGPYGAGRYFPENRRGVAPLPEGGYGIPAGIGPDGTYYTGSYEIGSDQRVNPRYHSNYDPWYDRRLRYPRRGPSIGIAVSGCVGWGCR